MAGMTRRKTRSRPKGSPLVIRITRVTRSAIKAKAWAVTNRAIEYFGTFSMFQACDTTLGLSR